jgi:hypothetical protein
MINSACHGRCFLFGRFRNILAILTKGGASMLRYNIKTGVSKIKTRTAIVASVVTLGIGGAGFGLAIPFAAHAAGGGYCVNSTNGCAHSIDNTVCAGHGAFGAFSGTANTDQKGSAVHGFVLEDKEQGISLGSETGPANSNLCGNPQNQ